ncbi:MULTISPECIES: energy transducer TonB [Providencia]|uniref:Energy transducer TonB n=2 Tax=Morganellaceae TaxID=1903414 RepID=A0AB35LCQ4_PRORE|nr:MULTISPECIES: energy transducer TonB [Providencia]AWS52480.1 energy transducer TonB [Providencia rettgeri]EHZ7766221.1 energy transducer TonB [Providencia rettgeri]EIJ7169363.1 energy transducer TonB [Providencia rettgeri]EJD6046597.1 energy transducer TonB [Providencia rettgeri]EJD6049443.1 energy transducer TonB [Providencia rettgeri]
MMSRKLITFTLSITLHILVIGYLTYVTAQSLSLKNQAQQDAPIISIALTQAVNVAEPEELLQPIELPSEVKIEPSPIIENAAVVVPKKQKKVIKTQKEPVKPKELTKRTENPSKQADSEIKNDLPIAQQQKAGDLVSSQSAGIKGPKNQHATSDTNSQLINAYREKLRQEVERNKQYPRRAKKMKNRGIATIQFQLSQTGEISLIRLASSSGNDLLDQAALLAVQKSRSVGKPPAGFAQSITLNIEFN